MKTTNKIAVVAVVLGIVAIVMSVGAALALMDISGGKEPNLTLEWAVVWIALPLIMIAQVVSIAAIITLLLRRRSVTGSRD